MFLPGIPPHMPNYINALPYASKAIAFLNDPMAQGNIAPVDD
jgi:hypothetical protein